MDYLMNTNKRRIKKTTSAQFDLMIHEMSQRPNVARGYAYGFKRNQIDADWREIAERLNSIGPPIRNISGWKKVWTDYRTRLRNRLNKIKGAGSKTKRFRYAEQIVMEYISDNSIASAITEHPHEDNSTSDSIIWQEDDSVIPSCSSQDQDPEVTNVCVVDYDEGYICPELPNTKDEVHGTDNNDLQSNIIRHLSTITDLLERQVVATEGQTEQMERQNANLEALMELLIKKAIFSTRSI